MSAVFGAVFCLDCCLTSVKRYEAQSGDTKSPTDTADTTHEPPNFVVSLSNGHEVHTRCVLIGAEQAPAEWIRPQVHR
ncbi:unnamed protein product [Echinostoma caproni]|uniref:Ig-like domain-containing protein n=1 Tax=Echinostoma caproni TaxID=27848 RepID=A0A183A483_9TREM|nr:unnamed protein product [Echinostoma caproni]